MTMEAKNKPAGVRKVQVFRLVSTISEQPGAGDRSFYLHVSQVRATPPPFAVMGKRPDTGRTRRPMSTASAPDTAATSSTSCPGTSGCCRAGNGKALPQLLARPNANQSAPHFHVCRCVTRLRQRCRAAPLFWPSHRPVSQNMKLL